MYVIFVKYVMHLAVIWHLKYFSLFWIICEAQIIKLYNKKLTMTVLLLKVTSIITLDIKKGPSWTKFLYLLLGMNCTAEPGTSMKFKFPKWTSIFH